MARTGSPPSIPEAGGGSAVDKESIAVVGVVAWSVFVAPLSVIPLIPVKASARVIESALQGKKVKRH